jgi:hypothetical protein
MLQMKYHAVANSGIALTIFLNKIVRQNSPSTGPLADMK